MAGINPTAGDTSNIGAGYGGETINDTSEGTRLVDIGTETASIAVIAESGKIYVGFDDQVDDTTGFPLEEGVSITMDLDVNQQGIFVFPESSGNEARWIAVG